MDTSALYDGEVVADSEDEESSLVLQMDFDMQTTFPDITNNIKPSARSEITSFSDKASAPYTSIVSVSSSSSRVCTPSSLRTPNDTICSSSNSGPLPRPKPRPAYKKKDGTGAINSSSSNLSPRVQTSTTIESSQFHMDIPPSIADRAKMRSRNSKSNAANLSSGRQPNMAVLSEDVIELSTDDDELALLSPPRPKPKSKGKGKGHTKSRAKASSDSPLSSAPESDPNQKAGKHSKTSLSKSPYALSNSQGTIPLATPIPFHLLSSQLPPSDPPMSTVTTCDFPPIETLPNIDTDPLSSPSSLFSDPISVRRKRKRVFQDYDELDSIDHQRLGIEIDAGIQMMPPPPVSRSFPARFGSPSADDSHHVASNDSCGNMDISTMPSRADMSANPVGPTNRSKTTKTRKKKGADNDTENGETSKADSKGKGKGKGKKRKKVEVVIQMAANKGKEKEVFKSREFIEDDDEDRLTVGGSNKNITASNKLSSVPDSDREDMLAGPSRQRKSSSGGSMPPVEDKILTDEEDEPAPKRSIAKAKRQSKDLFEDEDKGPITVSSLGVVSQDRPASAKHTSREKRSKSRKTSNAIPDVQSDSENQTKNSDIDQVLPQAALKDNNKGVLDSETLTNPAKPNESLFPSLSSRYTIAPKSKSTPMSELIRRVNSQPGSPFPTPKPRVSLLSSTGTAYSPYLKSSRSMLSRIAPLHPNRRTPPPPLPPPPPSKKTKKQMEREEQWEEAEEERRKNETYQYDEEY